MQENSDLVCKTISTMDIFCFALDAFQEPPQQPVIVTKFEKERASLLYYPDKEKPTHSYSLLNWLGSNCSEKEPDK